MATGTVKWFNPTKGFGFITPDTGGKDAFVHITEVERAGMAPLVEGQRISYEEVNDAKGLKAVSERERRGLFVPEEVYRALKAGGRFSMNARRPSW